MDPNHHLRNVLVRDAKAQCTALGVPPDAVLVSGDIAFAGEKDEYEFAQVWLEELCDACGCDFSKIFVIPGNHDVQRGIAGRLGVQAIHNDIKNTAEPHHLPDKISDFLNDEDTGKQLYGSIENFNDFATKYFCDLLAPDRTKIERRFKLNDSSTLCVTGLNSAFVSSHADKEGSLYVDPSGFTITRENGVVHLVLCHHPYNWLANGRELEDHLNDVVQIQLFGHEHTNRVLPGRDWFRVAASAAHPDRAERGWEPGYNLLELMIDTKEEQRYLEIKGHVRIWQNRPGQFVPKVDREKNHFHQLIPIDSWRPPVQPTPITTSEDTFAISDSSEARRNEEDTSMTSLRALSIRFSKLTFSKKLEIAGGLSLFEEADTKLPDHERFRQVLLRARERRVLQKLESEIASAELSPTPEQKKEN